MSILFEGFIISSKNIFYISTRKILFLIERYAITQLRGLFARYLHEKQVNEDHT